ncbi:hypothetical protein ElyMa_002696100 [Elysia marginata]|uniref:Uncharacterized protein n=1 Tax=Elysia marginata TaxID=1093978 RepID=A0AAV4HBH1_9GAST|nr:hypothetical protein ElyMa_002696100 [Elysia marginata]
MPAVIMKTLLAYLLVATLLGLTFAGPEKEKRSFGGLFKLVWKKGEDLAKTTYDAAKTTVDVTKKVGKLGWKVGKGAVKVGKGAVKVGKGAVKVGKQVKDGVAGAASKVIGAIISIGE